MHRSTDLTRYTPDYTTNGEGRRLGKDLENQSGANMAGVRSLNVNNALVIAKNIANFNALVRVYNVNDVTWASVNNDWTDGIRINEDLGYDSI